MQNYIGLQIDRYHITERLGQGGMAVVYKAYDTRLERDVALKLIRTEAVPAEQHERLLERFEHEAKSQAKFSHPHILPVFDYGEIDGIPYLVMAFVPGGTLKQKTTHPMDPKQALAYVYPVADALYYAHQQGLIHRDVKPSNILIDANGHPLLSDFGIAKTLEGSDVSLTGTGLGVGTPEYIAPEQWQGQADQASDQYALGVVLFELLTGQKPYTADTPMAIALKQLNDPLPRPSSLVSGIPEPLEKLLYKALARNPLDRFAHLGAFRDALINLLDDWPSGSTEDPFGSSTLDDADTIDQWQSPLIGDHSQEVEREMPTLKARRIVHLPVWILWVGLAVVILFIVIFGVITATSGLTGLVSRSMPTVEDEIFPAMITATQEEILLATITATQDPAPILIPATQETVLALFTETAAPSFTQTETMISPTPTETQITLVRDASIATNPVDGALLVFVPEGEFVMGSNDVDAFSNESPQHNVYLDAFWIYQTEVTNGQFTTFIQQTGTITSAESRGWSWVFENNQWERVGGADWRAPQGIGSDLSGMEQHPVVHVSWFDAARYCEWAGGRLPTEAEWEKAARGTDGRRYPWGDSLPTCSLANYGDCRGGSNVVGSYPSGASPYGALDMAGNVWEWVFDYYEADYYAHSPDRNPTGPLSSDFNSLRGGSWARHSGTLRTSYRGRAFTGDSYSLYGFRCVIIGQP